MRNVTTRRKVKKIKKIKKKGAPTKKRMVESCSVCFDDCTGKTCTLECGHKFHTKCIFTWFNKNNNCPLCRAEVKELVRESRPNMETPPYGFLRIIFDMTDDQLATNPPPAELGTLDHRSYAIAAISMLDNVINSLTAEQYRMYRERALNSPVLNSV